MIVLEYIYLTLCLLGSFGILVNLLKRFEPPWAMKVPLATSERREFFMEQFPSLRRFYQSKRGTEHDYRFPVEYSSQYEVADFAFNLSIWQKQNAIVEENKRFYLIILHDGTVLFQAKRRFVWR